MWSLLLNTEITYKIRKNCVCYTEIQAARLEALVMSYCVYLKGSGHTLAYIVN